MKCGSTTLHDYLSDHPEIFMSHDKEPGFFVPEIWGDKDESEYLSLFSSVKDEKYIGESSTFYSKIPTFKNVPESIHNYNHNAKILYIVRNPFERIVSHYFHHRRNLIHAEKRSIVTAVKKDERYTAYSDYTQQISPYIDLFGKENVKVVKFESLIKFHQEVLMDIYSWLEVDKSIQAKEKKKSNAKPQRSDVVRGFGIMNKFRYSNFWNKLSPGCPSIVKDIGNKLAAKKGCLQLSDCDRKQLVKYLRPACNKIAYDLGDVTGDDYSDWIL